jgi:carbon-monoxide dehydrogenase large subunit
MAEGARPTDRWVGAPLPRREDARFVTGSATYVDDLPAPDALHLGFVRSPYAHAVIGAIDGSAARELEGVAAVVTADDIAEHVDPYPIAAPEGATVAPVPLPLLADGTVRFAGEPVAAVLAGSHAELEDALELVAVDMDPLAAVGRIDDALAADVAIHDVAADNVVVRWDRQSGDVEAAFAGADVVVRQRFRIPRLVAAPIEPRRALASYDASDDVVTVWLSAQDPHRPLANLAKILRRPAERIRVVVPDVGGAFGSKGTLAPEAAVAALLSIRTGHPVRWTETRSENFLAAYQGRGVEADLELAAAADGAIVGIRGRIVADMGAYLQPTSVVPVITTAMLMTGTYTIPAAHIEVVGVATNKVPVGPYRGAGRPEAALLVERMLDRLAGELEIDPVALRRRNLIPAEAFPYATPLGFVYDSGDYRRALDLAAERIGQARSRTSDARFARGVGVAMYVERVGGGAAPGPAALGETAVLSVERDGRIVLRTGSSAHGQGHETTFAQIVADVFGVHPDAIDVRQGDSRDTPGGVGTFASRSVTIGGSASLIAAERVRDRAIRFAASMLEVADADVAWADGRAHVRGAPERSAGLAEIATYAATATLPDALRDGLTEATTFTLPGPVFPAGAYAAEVEIELETGVVRVVRVVGVDDAGRIVNPLLAHGQVQGAVVQGLAEALAEEAIHDEDALPISASFVQYAVPSAPDVPPIEVSMIETPSPFDPLGAKGIGEGGAIGTPAAVANAVCRALARFGVRHVDVPFTPERILAALRHAGD